METLSRDNFAELFGNYLQENNLSHKRVAKTIGCSISTLDRLLIEETSIPTITMLKRAGLLMLFGIKRYSSIEEDEKARLADIIGIVGGGTIGLASIVTLVSALGKRKGFSLKGINEGLSELGKKFGGKKGLGVLLAAAVPLFSTFLGYSFIKTSKMVSAEYNLHNPEIDRRWEIPVEK